MSRSILRALPALALALVLGVAAPAVAQSKPTTAKDQLAFGVEMAQRGLWSEALFRFRQAQELDPGNPSVLNNLAVAHEALGMFEEALRLYREGLALSPQDRGLRNNYARFIDFYQRFKPDEEDEGGDPGDADQGEEGSAGSDSPQAPPEAVAVPGIAHRSTGVGNAVPSHRNRFLEVS